MVVTTPRAKNDKSGPFTGAWHFAEPFRCWCTDSHHSVDEAVILNDVHRSGVSTGREAYEPPR